jgi:hypothetical protein
MADVMQPLGYYRFLAGDLMSPIGLAAVPGGIPVAANAVMLTVDGSAVRFRDDGVPPDGGTGMAIQPTLNPFLYTGDLRAILFIAPSGAVLHVSFYQVL